MNSGLGPANAFFDTILSGDAANSASVGGRIYPGFVPSLGPGVDLYPNQVYAFISGPVLRGMGGEVLQAQPRYLVRTIGKGSFGDDVSAIAEAMGVLLDNATAEISLFGQVYAVVCQFEDGFERTAWSGNEQFSERGGYYRLTIEQE